MSDFSKLSDGALEAWYANFVDVANTNATVLGLGLPDILVLETARDDFEAARTGRANAAAAAIASTVDKNNNRTAVLALVGGYNAEWQADSAVSDLIIADLGLTVHDETPSTIGVFTPLNFVASGQGNGNVTMKWQRNGNKWGCNFFVEVSTDNGVTWSLKTATTKARITLIGVTIQPTIYRVRAERNGTISGASSQSLVYGDTAPVEESPLVLAA